jgi:hypothetical protein
MRFTDAVAAISSNLSCSTGTHFPLVYVNRSFHVNSNSSTYFDDSAVPAVNFTTGEDGSFEGMVVAGLDGLRFESKGRCQQHHCPADGHRGD